MHLVWRRGNKTFRPLFKFFFHACKHSISPGRKAVREQRLIGKNRLGLKGNKEHSCLSCHAAWFHRHWPTDCMILPHRFSPRWPGPGGTARIYRVNPGGGRHGLSRQTPFLSSIFYLWLLAREIKVLPVSSFLCYVPLLVHGRHGCTVSWFYQETHL